MYEWELKMSDVEILLNVRVADTVTQIEDQLWKLSRKHQDKIDTQN